MANPKNEEEAKQEEEEEKSEKPKFKKIQRKNLRQRRKSNDEDDDNSYVPLEDIKEKQKLRQRPNGISLVGLALGKKIAPEEEIALSNPLDIKSGGLVNVHSLKSGKVTNDDEYEVDIGTQFSAETNKRVEDDEMMKYIETELKKRKGFNSDEGKDANNESDPQKYLSPEDAALLSLPIHLRIPNSTNLSEEMLSNQMLNGIPEVDLGIEAKIKNIEATEEAKAKLIRDQQNKKDGPSHFVPTNMAVNFMQHNRFKIDDTNETKRKPKDHEHEPQVGAKGVKRATDDYHYDKFRKQFRRY